MKRKVNFLEAYEANKTNAVIGVNNRAFVQNDNFTTQRIELV